MRHNFVTPIITPAFGFGQTGFLTNNFYNFDHKVEERRFSPRVFMPYPARLWGSDSKGHQWKEDALIDNVSAGGLYLRLNRRLPANASVSVAVRLSTAPAAKVSALHLGARGIVLRTELQPDGTCGVALEFSRRRVL